MGNDGSLDPGIIWHHLHPDVLGGKRVDQPDLGASHRQPQIIGIGRVETPLKLYQGESGFAGSVWAPLFASKEIGVVKKMSKHPRFV